MHKAKKLLNSEINTFELFFKDSVKSKVSLLDTILRYIVKHKGKQIRPIFVLLSAKLVDQPNDKTYRAASLVELLHNATLVHDDIVDNAYLRRGVFSINALWKNKIAVLVGDYLLSKGLLLSLENKDFEILTLLSKAVKEMSEGELLQMEKSRKLNINEEEYFSVINGKTASLLSAACSAGMASVTSDLDSISKLQELGTNIGLAFQIKDDLFDFGGEDIGKPIGNDLKEKKITLPLIYTFDNVETNIKNKIKKIISNEQNDKKSLKFIFDTVNEVGGIKYAQDKMNEYKNNALTILNTFGNNEVTEAYEDLIEFVINRNK